jgi:hypothetical protein
MGCAVLGFLGVTALGLLKGRVRLIEVAAGFGTFLVASVAAVVVVGITWYVLGGVLVRMDVPVLRYDLTLLTGFAVLAVVIAGAILAWSSRRWLWGWEGLGLGILGWWLAATVATSLWLTGASYAFVWPLLAILAGQGVSFLVPRGGTAALLASWLGVVPLLVIHAMILPGIFHGLNLRMAAPLVIPVLLVAGALVPLAGQVLNRR